MDLTGKGVNYRVRFQAHKKWLKQQMLSQFEFEWRIYALSAYNRPSLGREHTVIALIQSGDDDYLMNETRRKPTTATRCPTLFDKWHGIFYAQSHRHGWTYQGLYLPRHGPLGGSQSVPAQGRLEPLTCRSTVEHTNHQTR